MPMNEWLNSVSGVKRHGGQPTCWTDFFTDSMTDEEFKEYATKVFPYRVDTMWDNVDDWIKYGDMFLKLEFPDERRNDEL
jgi:hypothetical protein